MNFRSIALVGLLSWAAFSCEVKRGEIASDKLPYYDLKSFVDLQIQNLGDSVEVLKTSRIDGKENTTEVKYSSQDWKEEFEMFYRADINIPALSSSYSTETEQDYLIHRLAPGEKGKVKELKIRYASDLPVEVSFKMEEENLFFSTVTFGSIYMNQSTQKVDHYAIETTQKVVFRKASNIKIEGVIQ